MVERLSITTEEYFALPYASNSGIKEAHEMMKKMEFPVEVDSKAYAFGSALDALLTDPTTMDTTGLTDEDMRLLHPMRRSLEKNPIYLALFRNAERQAVFVDTKFPIILEGMETTIPAKCKYDWWNPKLNFGGDLKTTQARTLDQFISASKWFNYDQQAAWYMDITGTDRFVIIGVSKWNYATFEISYRRADKNHAAGKVKYLNCAASWWKLNGSAA